MQVDPIKSALKGAGTKRLKLKHHKLLSNFAFKFNVRRYNVDNDLRISHPWPELWEFAKGFDLATLDDVTFKHVPYVVLLLQVGPRGAGAGGGVRGAGGWGPGGGGRGARGGDRGVRIHANLSPSRLPLQCTGHSSQSR